VGKGIDSSSRSVGSSSRSNKCRYVHCRKCSLLPRYSSEDVTIVDMLKQAYHRLHVLACSSTEQCPPMDAPRAEPTPKPHITRVAQSLLIMHLWGFNVCL
jgi:hypothetical protein